MFYLPTYLWPKVRHNVTIYPALAPWSDWIQGLTAIFPNSRLQHYNKHFVIPASAARRWPLIRSVKILLHPTISKNPEYHHPPPSASSSSPSSLSSSHPLSSTPFCMYFVSIEFQTLLWLMELLLRRWCRLYKRMLELGILEGGESCWWEGWGWCEETNLYKAWHMTLIGTG